MIITEKTILVTGANRGIKYGTSRFDDTLVRDRLIDEFRFWIRPVVAGTGQRLFEHVEHQCSTSGSPMREGWRTGR